MTLLIRALFGNRYSTFLRSMSIIQIRYLDMFRIQDLPSCPLASCLTRTHKACRMRKVFSTHGLGSEGIPTILGDTLMSRVFLMVWPPFFVKFPTFLEAQHRLVGMDMTTGRKMDQRFFNSKDITEPPDASRFHPKKEITNGSSNLPTRIAPQENLCNIQNISSEHGQFEPHVLQSISVFRYPSVPPDEPGSP